VKKYVIVGVGGRSTMYTEALSTKYKDSAKLAAICDNNEGRLAFAERELKPMLAELKS
jgi:hypothetical protein